jgi:hypothetical protein
MSSEPWKIDDPNAIQLGWWFSECCPLDTYEIDDGDTLQQVRERMGDEDERCGLMVWPSYGAALAYWKDSREDGETIADLEKRRPHD